MRAITVDGPAFHNLGASASWELAGASPRGGRLPAAAQPTPALGGRGCVAADQFPLRRRRRPVHDDREVARGAPTVGAGRRGGGRRRTPAPRRVHAVTSLPMMAAARSVGEHAAHHAGGVRRRRRRRRHRAGAAVRRGDPRRFPGVAPSFARRIARNTQLLLLEESHLGRVLDPAGRVVVRRGPHRAAGRAGVGSTSGTSRRAAGSSRRRDFVAERSPRCASPSHRRHRTPAHRLTGVNEFPDLAEPPLPPS